MQVCRCGVWMKSLNIKETLKEIRRFVACTSSTALAECEPPANFDDFKPFHLSFEIKSVSL